MARSSYADVTSLGDPAQLWNFDLFFPVLPGSSNSRDLTIRCQSTDMPGTQLEPLDVALHGVQIPYAGRRMYTQSLNVTFLETYDWETRSKFFRWMELARSWTNNSGSYHATYSTTALLIVYDDIPQPIKTNRIFNIWPENVQEVQLDGSQSGPVVLSVGFKYSHWDILD